MLETGRLCVKTAGRDAMQYCVVVEEIDEKNVLIDGNTRRKKVNKAHLEPLNKTLKIKKGADTKTVHEAFKEAEITVKKSAEQKPKKEQKPQQKKETKKKEDKKTSKTSKTNKKDKKETSSKKDKETKKE
jgi:large subunit ribosomal protein L14e